MPSISSTLYSAARSNSLRKPCKPVSLHMPVPCTAAVHQTLLCMYISHLGECSKLQQQQQQQRQHQQLTAVVARRELGTGNAEDGVSACCLALLTHNTTSWNAVCSDLETSSSCRRYFAVRKKRAVSGKSRLEGAHRTHAACLYSSLRAVGGSLTHE